MSIQEYKDNALAAICISEDGSVSIETDNVSQVSATLGSTTVYVYLTADDKANVVRSTFNILKNASSPSLDENAVQNYLWSTKTYMITSEYVSKYFNRFKGRILLQILLAKVALSFASNTRIACSTGNGDRSRVFAPHSEWSPFTSTFCNDASLVCRRDYEYFGYNQDDTYIRALEDAYSRLGDLSLDKETDEYMLAYISTRMLSVTGLAYYEDIDISLGSSMKDILIAYALASYPDTVSLICIGSKEKAEAVLGVGLSYWRKILATHMYGYTPNYICLSSFVSYYESEESLKIPFSKYRSLLFNTSVSYPQNTTNRSVYSCTYYSNSLVDTCRAEEYAYEAVCAIKELRELNSRILSSAQLGGSQGRLPSDYDSSGAWSIGEDLISMWTIFAIANSPKDCTHGAQWSASNVAQDITIPIKTQNDADVLTRDIYYTTVDGKKCFYPLFRLSIAHFINSIASTYNTCVAGYASAEAITKSGVLNYLTESVDSTLANLFEPGKVRKTAMSMHSLEMANFTKHYEYLKKVCTSEDYQKDRDIAQQYSTEYIRRPDLGFRSPIKGLPKNCRIPGHIIISSQHVLRQSSEMFTKSQDTRLNKVLKSLKTKDSSYFMKTWRFSYGAGESILPRTYVDLYRIAGYPASSAIYPRKESCIMATSEVLSKAKKTSVVNITLPEERAKDITLLLKAVGLHKVDSMKDIFTSVIAFEGVRMHLETISSSGGSMSHKNPRCVPVLDFSGCVFDKYLRSAGFWSFSPVFNTSSLDKVTSVMGKLCNMYEHIQGGVTPRYTSVILDKVISYKVTCIDGEEPSDYSLSGVHSFDVSIREVLKNRAAIVLSIAQRIYTAYGMNTIIVNQFFRYPSAQKPEDSAEFDFLTLPDSQSDSDLDLFCVYINRSSFSDNDGIPASLFIGDNYHGATNKCVRFNAAGIVDCLDLFDSSNELGEYISLVGGNYTQLRECIGTALKLVEVACETNWFTSDILDRAVKTIKSKLLGLS